MLLTNKPETKEIIVTLLSKGALDSVDLQKQVEGIKAVTKQGFYKALRELIKDEVVAKNKHLVVLNNAWVNKLHNLVQTVDNNYQVQADDSFLNLEEGETLVYHFKTVASLDILWMHYFFLVAKKEPSEDLIFYNSHEFWSLFRHEAESFMYKWIVDNNRTNYIVIGGTSPLDRSTTAYIKDMGLQLAYEPDTTIKRNSYVSVIGDYLLETVLDMNTANAIDKLYEKYPIWNEDVAKELGDILSRIKRSKVVIERNKGKAEKLRKRLLKHFVFYK